MSLNYCGKRRGPMEERGCVFLERPGRGWGPAPILSLAFEVNAWLKSLRSMGLCMCQSSRAKALYWVKVQQLEQKLRREVRFRPSPLPSLGTCALETGLFIRGLLFPGECISSRERFLALQTCHPPCPQQRPFIVKRKRSRV